MNKVGYINYWGHDFIVIDKDEPIYLIPKNNDNTIQEIREHFKDKDFIFTYETNSHFCSVAHIEKVNHEFPNIVVLHPKYCFQGVCHDKCSYLEILGDVIDDFFNPVRLIFSNPDYENNYKYITQGVSEKWIINFEGAVISVELFFQEPLKHGLLGDQKLHPILRVRFPETHDFQYIYKIYSIVVRFLKLIRYDRECGKLTVALYTSDKQQCGRLLDFTTGLLFHKRDMDVNSTVFQPYIGRFFQFAANMQNYSFIHYPSKNIRFSGSDYQFSDCVCIFPAFEAEYKANKDVYGKIDLTPIQNIKSKVKSRIEEVAGEAMNPEEIAYMRKIQSIISQVYTQFSLRQEIIKAYECLEDVMFHNIPEIFFRTIKYSDKSKYNINKISSKISDLRNKYSHGDTTATLDDEDSEYIRFLEILIYSMLLKRMEFLDEEISDIVRAIFILM